MNIIKLTTLSLALTASTLSVCAQDKNEQSFVHEQSEASDYVWPEDPQVLQNLKHWQDQKFGVLMHWGLYSKAGIVESWSICSEDWIRRERFNDYEKDKQWYWSLKDSLNPVKFNPDLWADVMKKAGMKYMIFTTKHHDGFCMFDSKYTDFSIAHGPFANNPRKNVAKEVFDAYRKQGFMIGCYFSKPDWHSKWFWNPYYATPRRGINYSIKQHPDWWQNYVKFTQNQLSELPAKQLNIPWESCITLSHAWGYIPGAKFKSPAKVIAILSEIVAKGGCLALGVGPTPDGTIQPEVQKILLNIGSWMNRNGEAIYNTVTTPHYNDGKTWFTASKNKKTLYAVYAIADGETAPQTITWTVNKPKGKLVLLNTGKAVKYTTNGDKVTVKIPAGTKAEPLAFKFEKK